MNTPYLFVYGTLRSDSHISRSDLLSNATFLISKGFVHGQLFDLGWYPGLVPSDDPEHRVFGEIYKMEDSELVLPGLDEYEGCSPKFPKPHEYRREIRIAKQPEGKKMKVWTYIYNHSPSDKKLIPSGDFVEYIKESQ